MNPGDFLVCTFRGDAPPAPTYVAEIRLIDPVPRTASCVLVDTGQTLIVDYSPGAGAPWDASDDAAGTGYVLETHDVYVAENASPGENDVALLSFADGSSALCFVESITDTVNVQCYQSPQARLALMGEEIASSDWDAHPAGEQVSIQRCYLDNSVPAEEVFGVFSNGWWSLATRRDAFAGRIGGAINPFTIVVHTTAMAPETWNALIRAWQTQIGGGQCAHFLIGRSAAEGVVQFASIDRNANHAGGPGHGSFVAGNQTWHPNLVSVGIEIHCAGNLRLVDGEWRLLDNGEPTGRPIPDEDVISDPVHADRSVHKVTDYQYEQLAALLDGLDAAIDPMPAGCVTQSLEPPPAWAVFPTGRIVGHVSLHTAARSDPHKQTCDWIRARL